MYIDPSMVRLLTIKEDGSAEILLRDQAYIMVPKKKVVTKDSCFVCDAEDALNEPRGTQSHPIDCNWRIDRENKGHREGLEAIHQLCDQNTVMQTEEILDKIKNIALSSLFKRYDMKD
jgi:hypothetical protein